MKTHTILKTTALILALITVSLTTAATSCDCGEICVNETGWWRDGGAFNASEAPIQAAVNNVTAGETIYVKAGSYPETVDIATAHLTLTGAGADVVNVTNSTADHHIFKVTADYVNISGFTVIGAIGSDKAGIYLNGADHCNISDNTASNNEGDGIDLYGSSDNILLNNTASNNEGDGIELRSSSNNTLTGNTVNSNHYDGIYLDSSSDNTLLNNTASNNDGNGIELCDSSNNMLKNNAANSNRKYIYSYNDGIYLDSSSNNTLLNNTALNNEGDGIGISYSSNNTLTGNTANSNHYDGIYLEFSSKNIILNNTASNNDKHGIYIEGSSDNLIYNNYWSNANNVYDDGSNRWNVTILTGSNIIGGPSVGGNYWSDYTCADPDGDGFGEEPYSITDGSNFDYHPLCLSGASVKGDLNGDGKLTHADATIALRLAATNAHDDAADVSGDGSVTSLDALMILQAAAEMLEL